MFINKFKGKKKKTNNTMRYMKFSETLVSLLREEKQ